MRVLLVEDEPMIRKGISKLLHQTDIEGFHISDLIEAENAEEAEVILQAHTFDFIFTDIEMGEMNGLALMEKSRKEHPNSQWIVISGYDHFEYAQRAITYGVKEYILKPVTKKKMREVIMRCLNNRQDQMKGDFVGANLLEEYLEDFENAIWSIDRSQLISHFNEWREKLEEKIFYIDYYNDLLSHMLDSLFSRINRRGSQIVQTVSWQVNAKTIEEANNFFLNICIDIIEMIEVKRKGNEVDPIEVAKQYIIDRLNKEISLDEVANKLGLNASYFSQLFKKETGETFVRYRIRLRMEKAKELLLKHDVRIIDIPSLIGLNDHPHFTKTFKKYTGHTPTEFRNRMGIH